MGVVAGPMGETVHESLGKFTDTDLHDIVLYLKSTPPKPSYTAQHDSSYAGVNSAGAQVYLNNCASCHQLNGEGLAGAVPALKGNGAVTAKGPQDVIRVVLGGLSAQGTYAPMPGVGVGMTDQQVADVTNYVRQSWGNAAPATAGAGMVGTLRAETHTLWNATIPSGCPALAQPEVAKAVADPSTGIAALLQQTNLVNMVPNVDAILGKIEAAAPGVKQNDLVNALTIAYCPVVLRDPKLPFIEKRVQLDQFGERVYTQIVSHGKS
jgi:mono/diheme cytochrome c family protein